MFEMTVPMGKLLGVLRVPSLNDVAQRVVTWRVTQVKKKKKVAVVEAVLHLHRLALVEKLPMLQIGYRVQCVF
jgi:hypothetical protein